MQKEANGFLTNAESMLAAMESVALSCLALTPNQGPLKTLCDQEVATVKKIREDKKNHFEPEINEHFVRPIQGYLVQYKEIQTRIGERTKRKDKMDKLKEKRDKLAEKNDLKLGEADREYEQAKQGYDDLNDELIKDMPLLHEDSEKFFVPIMSLFIVNKTKFFQALNAHIYAESQSLDLTAARTSTAVVEVITPQANSAIHRTGYQLQAPQPGDPASTGVSPRSRNSSNVAPAPGYPTGIQSQPQQQQPYAPQQQQPYGAPQQQQPPQQGYAQQPPPQSYAAPAAQVPIRPMGQPPVPARVPQAKALWDFQGQPGELSFRAGEMINVHTSQGEWWTGEIPGRGSGSFPHNYVQMV